MNEPILLFPKKTLLAQLNEIQSSISKANQIIDHELRKPGPTSNPYSDILHLAFGMGSSFSRRRKDFDSAISRKVKQQQNLTFELEEKYLSTIEHYAKYFGIVRDAIKTKYPFSKTTKKMRVSADKLVENCKFIMSFNPVEFLSQFPELQGYSLLFDTSWKIYIPGQNDNPVNTDIQTVRGRFLHNIPIFPLAYNRISMPTGRIIHEAEMLENHLRLYYFKKKEFEGRVEYRRAHC